MSGGAYSVAIRCQHGAVDKPRAMEVVPHTDGLVGVVANHHFQPLHLLHVHIRNQNLSRRRGNDRLRWKETFNARKSRHRRKCITVTVAGDCCCLCLCGISRCFFAFHPDGYVLYDARATGYFVQKAKCRGGGDNVQSRIVVNFFHICDNCAHFCRVDFFPSQM